MKFHVDDNENLIVKMTTISEAAASQEISNFFENILEGLETYPEYDLEIPQEGEITVPDNWGGFWYIPVLEGIPQWDEGGHSSDPDPDWDGA
jgi:hypothetical protein